jgi:hypothetical protein
MLQWIVLLAAVELAAHEPWGGPGLSVGFGVQVTVAMLFGPLEAGLIAFAGGLDARWPRGRIRPRHDLSHCSTSRRASWPCTCVASGARWPSSRS